MTEYDAQTLYFSGLKPTVKVLLMQDDVLKKQEAQLKQYQRQLALKDNHPSTPSGMLPVYAKPSSNRRRKTPGRKKGHPASRRAVPDKIDRVEEHSLEKCPHCDNALPAACQTRVRYTEDIPPVVPQVTKHVISRYYCATCRCIVEPVVTAALSKSTLGLRTVIYSAWLHYGLGLSLAKIVELFNISAHFKVSSGGLCRAWHNLAMVLQPAYDQIGKLARHSAVLHADETGWRVNGSTYWLWCFTNRSLVYFVINRTRGSPVVLKVLGRLFTGILISDFFAVYDKIAALAKQKCLVHLLRELAKVDIVDTSLPWRLFRNQLKRLIKDAFRLQRERASKSPEQLALRKKDFEERLRVIFSTPYPDKQVQRLQKRLLRHQDSIFTFLDHADVPPDNNHAERQIRPAVILRKISYGNHSERGADIQAIFMSVFRTLQLRGQNPVQNVLEIIEKHLASGKPPALLPCAADLPGVAA